MKTTSRAQALHKKTNNYGNNQNEKGLLQGYKVF